MQVKETLKTGKVITKFEDHKTYKDVTDRVYHLAFENMKLEKACLLILAVWLRHKQCLMSFHLNKVTFEDKTNFA